MIKTIKYFLKKKYLFMGIATAVLLLISFSTFHSKSFIAQYSQYDKVLEDHIWIKGPADLNLNFIWFGAIVLCLIVPILDFSFKMRKIHIDQMYSLPIKREKLYLAKFIVGFISILIPITIVFIDVVINVAFAEHMYEIIYFLPFYFAIVFSMLILYSTTCFFYTRANTIVDGIFNIAAIMLAGCLFMGVLEETFHIGDPISNMPWYPIYWVNNFFEVKLREAHMPLELGYKLSYDNMPYNYFGLGMMTLLGIASFVLFVYLNKKEKAENSMQVSSSWFSYKFFIPFYMGFLIMYLILQSAQFITIILVTIAAYVGYIIFRRTVKIKKVDYIVLASCFVLAIILGLVFDYIENLSVAKWDDHYGLPINFSIILGNLFL